MNDLTPVEQALIEIDQNPQVQVNSDGTKTVILTTAIQKNGQPISEVTFRRPKGKDWLETDKEKGELGKAFRLAASLSGLTMEVFSEMDGDDAMLCCAVAGTMGKKLQTGGTS